MFVQHKASYMVKPYDSSSPINPIRTLSLSEWDHIGNMTHANSIYFYTRPSEKWLAFPDTILNTLKDSLSRVLVPFYPLAGRLRSIGRGRFELNCNNEGVKLIEAETESNLEDLSFYASPFPEYPFLVPSENNENDDGHFPLVLVQLTKFKCGGISLGISMSHVVADGRSMTHFVAEWVRIARGETIKMMPFLDRNSLRSSHFSNVVHENNKGSRFYRSSMLISRSIDEIRLENKTVDAMLRLTNVQVDRLKNKANETNLDRPYSRYEVVTAHIWKCITKARGLKPDRETAVGVCVDSRGRMKPPLPGNYFGNAILDVAAISTAGELVEKPLGYACGIIRATIEKVDDKYLRSVLSFLEKQKDLSPYQDHYGVGQDEGPLYGYPNIGVVSLLGLPLYAWDFGWGKEICARPGTYDFDGDTMILPSPDHDGSLLVALCLQVDHMEAFKKFFYQDSEKYLLANEDDIYEYNAQATE